MESLKLAHLKLSVSRAVQVKLRDVAKVNEWTDRDVEISTKGAPGKE